MTIKAQLQAAFQWRYAVKKFDSSQKIMAEEWSILEDALLFSPSSYGLQPWKFLVVENLELRKQLMAASWNQSQVVDASHYVVFTTLKNVTEDYLNSYLEQMATTRGVELAKFDGLRKVMMGDLVNGPRAQVIGHWAQKQAYIAMGNLMQAAALLKIDSCPLEGIDPSAYDKLLKLNDTPYTAVAAVALGYRSSEDKYQHMKKVRFPKDKIIQIIK